MAINVLVNGALGRMGREVVKAVIEDEHTNLAGAVDIVSGGENIGEILNVNTDVVIQTNLQQALDSIKPQVVVDFTRPDIAMDNVRTTLKNSAYAVVGTTGFSEKDLKELDELASKNNVAVLIAPNFSLGANLMMRLSQEAIKYFPKAEIIELHHDNKLDAPSGTAVLTAQKLSDARGGYIKQGHPDEEEKIKGARGADIDGIRVHSVRLQGYVAHQEVIFGSFGETLIVRHDSISRECYMPGVMYACREIVNHKGLVYGLDKIMN